MVDGNSRERPPVLMSHAEVEDATRVYLLPHEVDLMHQLFHKLKAEHSEMADLLAEAMSQSSETYHDNAPADAARDEAEIVGWKALQLVPIARNYQVIEYLRPENPFVGIGTRATIQLGEHTQPFIVEVVGAHNFGRKEYELTDKDGEAHEVDVITYLSPIGQAIYGRSAGEQVATTIGERDVVVAVLGVEQLGDPRLREMPATPEY